MYRGSMAGICGVCVVGMWHVGYSVCVHGVGMVCVCMVSVCDVCMCSGDVACVGAGCVLAQAARVKYMRLGA